jgi:hypothetical protein
MMGPFTLWFGTNRKPIILEKRLGFAAEGRNRITYGRADVFISEFSKRTTLYTSNGDLPVYLSSIIHHGPRAGYFKPYTVAAGVDTIAVPDFDVDMLGHSYFAQAEALLYDIRSLILHNEAPRKRLRISPANEDGLDFWKLGR